MCRALGVHPWLGKQLYVAGAGQVFDAEGKLTDPKIQKLLGEYLQGLSRFVTLVQGSR